MQLGVRLRSGPYNLNGDPQEANNFDSGYDRLYGSVHVPVRNRIYFIDDRTDYARVFTDGNTLPVGVSFANGVVSGTPTQLQPATAVTFIASNIIDTSSIDISFEVETRIPIFGAIELPPLTVGEPYSYTIPVFGSAPITISADEQAIAPERDSDFDITFPSGTVLQAAAYRFGGSAELYFAVGNVLQAYSDNTRHSDLDITLSGFSGTIRGLCFDDTRIYVLDNTGNTLRAFNYSGGTESTDNVSLGSSNWAGASFVGAVAPGTNQPVAAIVRTNGQLRLINLATGSTINTISLPSGNWQSVVVAPQTSVLTPETMLVSRAFVSRSFSGHTVRTYDWQTLSELTDYDFSPSDSMRGGAFSNTSRLYICDGSNTAKAYITLGSGLPPGIELENGVLTGTPTTAETYYIRARARNSEGSATVLISFEVASQAFPLFVPSTQPAFTRNVGDEFALDLNATGTPPPTYSATNLPDGLNIDATTGIISGTFTTEQTITSTITASNGVAPDATVTIQFTVSSVLPALQFVPQTQPSVTGNVGSDFNLDLDATGNPAPTYSATNLPDGLNIDATTGIISGTFATSQTITATITASNGVNPDGTVSIQFTIISPLTAPQFVSSTPTSATGNVGQLFNLDLDATGNPAPTYSASNLPTGLQINATTGVISGTPTTTQTITATITASNGVAPAATVNIQFTVALPFSLPQFGDIPTQNLQLNVESDEYTLPVTGNPTPTVDYNIVAPSRVSADDNVGNLNGGGIVGDRVRNNIYSSDSPTGVMQAFDYSFNRVSSLDFNLSGSGDNFAVFGSAIESHIFMSENDFGTSTYIIRRYDWNGTRYEFANISIDAPFIYPQSMFATHNRLYVVNHSTNTLLAYDFNLNAVPDDNVTLEDADWRGSATALDEVIYIGEAVNSTSRYLRAFDYNFNRLPDIDIDTGAEFPFSVWSTDTRLYYAYAAGSIVTARAYTLPSNTLPAGISLNNGVLSGTPARLLASRSTEFEASNSEGSATASISFTVNAALSAPQITFTPPAQVHRVGDGLNIRPTATGNPTPTWSALNLPSGISINATTGRITGTFTAIQTRTTTITASNGQSPNATTTISFTVNAPLEPLSAPQISPKDAGGYQFPINVEITPFTPFTATGNPAPQWSGGLPPGLEIDPITGEISGTPTTLYNGVDSTVRVTNSEGSDFGIISLQGTT